MRSSKKWFGIIAAIAVCLAVSGSARASTTWLEKQKLLASDGAAVDYFGCSVSISGDFAIVGAYGDDDNGSWSGSAYIFKWDGTTWVEQKLLASDSAASDYFGCSVSISGDSAIVGAPADNFGSAYIFAPNDIDPNNWDEQQKLLALDEAAGDSFGYSVSISGDLAIVGAVGDDDNGSLSGSAYIFAPNNIDPNNWDQQAKLLASDGAAEDCFGYSVSISVDLAIVGAYRNDDNGSWSGSAYIFKWDGTSWVEQKKLLASDGAADDLFGYSVSISGDFAIVGAHGDNFVSAYIFKWDGTSWVEQQ